MSFLSLYKSSLQWPALCSLPGCPPFNSKGAWLSPPMGLFQIRKLRQSGRLQNAGYMLSRKEKKNMHIIFGVLAMLRLSSTRTEIVQNFPRMRQKTGSFFCRGRKCLSNRRTDFRTALHLPNTTSSYTQSGREDSTVRRCGDGHQLRWL